VNLDGDELYFLQFHSAAFHRHYHPPQLVGFSVGVLKSSSVRACGMRQKPVQWIVALPDPNDNFVLAIYFTDEIERALSRYITFKG